jgi:hypothetical protein
MIALPPTAARLLLGAFGIALLWAGIQWYGHKRYQEGVAYSDAQWAAASQRMQTAATRAANAADAIATQREAEQRAQIEDLKHEAAKGNDDAVGPGVAAVLSGLRAQQGR